MNKILKHFANWPELYLVIPILILGVPAAGLLAYSLTGRQPVESMGWLVDLSNRALQIGISILGVSCARQAFGHWLTKDEYLAHPFLGMVQSVLAFSGLCVLLYFVSH